MNCVADTHTNVVVAAIADDRNLEVIDDRVPSVVRSAQIDRGDVPALAQHNFDNAAGNQIAVQCVRDFVIAGLRLDQDAFDVTEQFSFAVARHLDIRVSAVDDGDAVRTRIAADFQ